MLRARDSPTNLTQSCEASAVNISILQMTTLSSSAVCQSPELEPKPWDCRARFLPPVTRPSPEGTTVERAGVGVENIRKEAEVDCSLLCQVAPFARSALPCSPCKQTSTYPSGTSSKAASVRKPAFPHTAASCTALWFKPYLPHWSWSFLRAGLGPTQGTS